MSGPGINRRFMARIGLAAAAAVAVAACTGEDRPGLPTGSGSESASASASGIAPPGFVWHKPEDAIQVDVTLAEWYILPSVSQVQAGKVYFLADNIGPEDPHELVVIKTDRAPHDLPVVAGRVVEDNLQMIGEIRAFAPGTRASGIFQLEPGKYALICNIAEVENGVLESHYELGMRIPFTVTRRSG